MTLRHVQRGDFITASGWNEMIDRLNQTAEGQAPVWVSSDISISNMMSFDFPTGQVVPIAGMRRAYDGPDGCFRNFLESGFQLEGGYASAKFYAVTKEAIPKNRTGDWRHNSSGPASVPFSMVAAIVYSTSNAAMTRAKVIPQVSTAEYFAAAPDGDFEIVAQSSAAAVSFGDYTYRRFCYLTKVGGRLEVTYYDSSGNQHAGVSVARMVLGQNAFRAAQDGSDSSLLTVNGPTYSLGGATSPVTNVTVDSNGDLVLTREPITLTKSF